MIYLAIKTRWVALKSETYYLGYPIIELIDVPGGRCVDLQHGSISWNSTTGKVLDVKVACSKA